MIPPWKVQRIKELLENRQLSQRQIAKTLDVARGTVSAIAQGHRQDVSSGPRPVDSEPPPQGPPQRCPKCGALVYLPCRACQTRARAVTRPRTQRQRNSELFHVLCELDLKAIHRARYELVRRRRLRQECLARRLYSDLRSLPTS